MLADNCVRMLNYIQNCVKITFKLFFSQCFNETICHPNLYGMNRPSLKLADVTMLEQKKDVIEDCAQ